MIRKPTEGVAWYELDIREHKGGLLLQLWASVEAVLPELCPEQTAEGILWPGDARPMTHVRANALMEHNPVYLDDRFLQKYEQSTFYGSTPAHVWGRWYCSPSYRGQWSFTECRRVGRNLVQVPKYHEFCPPWCLMLTVFRLKLNCRVPARQSGTPCPSVTDHDDRVRARRTKARDSPHRHCKAFGIVTCGSPVRVERFKVQ